MEQDVVAVHLDSVRAQLGEIRARTEQINGMVINNETRLSVLEPSVETAHERLNELDKRTGEQSAWIARNEGRAGGMKELITLICAAIAAAAGVARFFAHG